MRTPTAQPPSTARTYGPSTLTKCIGAPAQRRTGTALTDAEPGIRPRPCRTKRRPPGALADLPPEPPQPEPTTDFAPIVLTLEVAPYGV